MRAAEARIAAALFLIGYLFWFAGGGLWARFTGDDLMNLNFHLKPSFAHLLLSNLTFWTTAYRPMGGVVYAAVYRLAGFHPMPFRAVCFVLLFANLALAYRLFARLGGSAEVGLLATLFVTYHAWFVNLYYSTGTIYELLCFGFYVAAFDYYVRIRGEGHGLRAGQWAVLLALYIGALNSKELAVTFPVCLLCYECIWHRRGIQWRAPVVCAILTGIYIVGKLTGVDSLVANPAYRPAISASRYLHTFHLYLNVLFYQDHFFRDANTILLVVLMLAAAIWLRSRVLVFAWCFVLFSVLPFIFVPHYSGFFLYLPMVGWALYAATCLAMLRRKFVPKLPGAVLFLVVAVVLEPVHGRESHKSIRVFSSADLPTTETIAALQTVQPSVKPGANIYFASDPFPAHTFDLVFLVRLFYDDLTISVARAKDGDPSTGGGPFDAVFRWEDGTLKK